MKLDNPCTRCGQPGIPGLVRGTGKCQYHWREGVWGKAWADEVQRREAITAYYTDRANGAHAAKAP